MKIAFLTPEYVTESNFDGGLANYLFRSCRALKDFGHKPIVIVGASINQYIEDNGIPVYRVNINHMPSVLKKIPLLRRHSPALMWAMQSWRLNKTLSQIHAKEKIDIAQYSSHMATAYFRIRSLPSVVRISSIYSLLNEAYDWPQNTLASGFQYLEMKAAKNADCLICPSRNVAELVQKRSGKLVTVVESPYIPPAVIEDPAPFHDLLRNKRYLLFFGTVGLLKGVKTIADTIYSILDHRKDLIFVFIGKDVGYKDDLMMNYVWEKAGSLRGRVMYLGVMRHTHLMPIIRSAGAVVLPSLVDNFPNTCIEAMAQGQVVVGTKGTSFEQLIEDGTNGILCTIDNPPDLYRAIDKALSLSPEERLGMGIKAQERIYTLRPEVVIRKLLDVYEDLIRHFSQK